MISDYRDYTLSIKENTKYNVRDVVNFMIDKFQKDEWFYPLFWNYDYEDDIDKVGDISLDFEEAPIWSEDNYYPQMKELSKQFPECVFDLYCVGWEESDKFEYEYEEAEEWHCYFKNGKHQFCEARTEVVFDEYNESKLV